MRFPEVRQQLSARLRAHDGRLPSGLLTARDPVAAVCRIHGLLADRGHAIPVRLWNGQELGKRDAGYRLVLRHPWSLRRLLIPPNDLTAGEAYVFDAIDVEGSMIAALHDAARLRQAHGLRLDEQAKLLRALLTLPRPPGRRQASARARLRGSAHTLQRDRRAVRLHYDVGNAFYRQFLDERLVYSCAYFSDDDPGDPAEDPKALDRAQLRKLDLICRKLHLRAGDRFLDIGCGWGSLVLHAAAHYGARATGITLSTEQAALAGDRVAAAGLADRVEIRVEDYRETRGTYDAVASVGMFEHVGLSRFADYFDRARRLTARGGRFLNHAITTAGTDEQREMSAGGDSFIGSYVFPDGALAPAHLAIRHLEEAGFELLDVQQLRRHYALTLRHWLHNLEGRRDAVEASAGEEAYRVWRAYMAGAAVGFESGELGVVQVLGTHGHSDALPLGRSWMEPPPTAAAPLTESAPTFPAARRG